MTAVDEEVFVFDEADILPPCEYTLHGRFGDEPASWFLLLAWCRCGDSGTRLHCDPCFQYWSTAPLVRCRTCGYVSPPRDIILRAERL